jgi:hypothetical protein
MTPPTGEDTGDTLSARITTVLGAFRAGDDAVGAAELARRTGLPKSTVHRITGDLVRAGLLERHGRKVRLGLALFEIGQRVPRQRVLREAAGHPGENAGHRPVGQRQVNNGDQYQIDRDCSSNQQSR